MTRMTQNPAEPTLLPTGVPSDDSSGTQDGVCPPSAKRGSIFGGAATEEALASSRKVLSQTRGGGDAFTGWVSLRSTMRLTLEYGATINLTRIL